jgi:predicted DNA-binding protein (MmcQ/YjbR family)
MDLAAYNRFCASLPHTNHVVQWGDAHVWKVATKVFAIARIESERALHVTFKCSWTSFEILKEQPGLRPAPYLASRGMSWIQRISGDSMPSAALRDYLRESHRLAAQALSKKVQRELGLLDVASSPRTDITTRAPARTTDVRASRRTKQAGPA